MFRTRPRGSLRAAALLAVGASPLLAGVATAAPAPSLDGLGDLVGAPELNTNLVDRSGDIASNRSVRLPATPAPPLVADAAHALPGLPATPALPGFAEERALPAAAALPLVDQLPLNQLPINQLPSIDELPIQLGQGGLPIPLPGLG